MQLNKAVLYAVEQCCFVCSWTMLFCMQLNNAVLYAVEQCCFEHSWAMLFCTQLFCTQLTKAYMTEMSCSHCYWCCYVSAYDQFARQTFSMTIVMWHSREFPMNVILHCHMALWNVSEASFKPCTDVLMRRWVIFCTTGVDLCEEYCNSSFDQVTHEYTMQSHMRCHGYIEECEKNIESLKRHRSLCLSCTLISRYEGECFLHKWCTFVRGMPQYCECIRSHLVYTTYNHICQEMWEMLV